MKKPGIKLENMKIFNTMWCRLLYSDDVVHIKTIFYQNAPPMNG
jgi:hypothetical protein